MEGNLRKYLSLLFLSIGCLLGEVNAQESSLTLSGCMRGSGCSQCPNTKYTLDKNGEMLCCLGCAAALLYHGETPENWCVCYVEVNNNAAESKTLKFPGSTTSRFPPTSSSSGSSNFFFGTKGHSGHDATMGGDFRDALVTLTHGTERRGEVVSPAVHEAITLMANTIEDLNARLTFLENIILNSGLQGHTIERVGSAGDPPTTTIRPPAVPPNFSSGEPCSSVNFTRVGEVCYHASAWKNHRAIWEEASKACEKMGAKLAEPTDGSSFIEITQYLSLETSTTGYSYWIGGLYPGISWLWSYSGTMVTLSPSYWTGINAATGNRVAPGDTAPGRCLSFSYLQGASSYFFAADKCGFEKYYLCELLEKSHRML